MVEFSTVLGIDKKHLEQLAIVWPTWMRHKPMLREHPLVIFHDESVQAYAIHTITNEHPDVRCIPWPHHGVQYEGIGGDKWLDPHRYKMLSGFVHVPAQCVETPYWLKIDVDTVASGHNNWVDETWFDDEPAIVSHPWGFTKPADQMVKLDRWVANNAKNLIAWAGCPALKLKPKPGWSRVRHRRIISWCGFFNTEFTKLCSAKAELLCGTGKLPCHSQDGFLWYMAKRGEFGIVRANMKSRGWEHWTTMKNIRQASDKAMAT